MNDIHTFFKKLPILDPGEKWHHDRAMDMWCTDGAQSVRTKKVSRALVLYEATKEHPAQVKEVTEDVHAGTWTTVKHSSALPAQDVNEILGRVEKLQKAVKFAREQANSVEVDLQEVGGIVFDFLLD